MVNRVTDADVKVVVETTIADTTAIIDTAHLVVEEQLVPATPALTAAMLVKIELYLAAHFVALTEERGGLLRSSTGESAETVADVYSEGFRSTRYGQQAIALDTTGTLTVLSNQKLSAEFRVV